MEKELLNNKQKALDLKKSKGSKNINKKYKIIRINTKELALQKIKSML